MPDTRHLVAADETLASIADAYDTSPEDLFAANRGILGSNPDRLAPGMTLVIPGGAAAAYPSSEQQDEPTPEVGTPAAGDDSAGTPGEESTDATDA